jgi:hypothetical protein
MFSRRFRLPGLFAVLLALMAQLGAGGSVPADNPVADAAVLCHTDDAGRAPAHTPGHHPIDCPICPLCAPLHVSLAALIPAGVKLPPPAVVVVARTELPPPSTAPPSPHRPPSQPRAPPTFS